MMSESFANKVCVVTGAGSGIGREVVIALIGEGARVFALDFHEERLSALKEELDGLVVLQADVTDRDRMRAVADQIHQEAGHVDLLINNAGVTLLGETRNISFGDWRRVLDTNYLGTVYGIQSFYPKMVERKGGHIVNIASIAGSSGYASAQAYAVSKGAVIGFGRSLQVEAAMHGVTVTTVCPSYVDTAIFSDSLEGGWTEATIRSTFLTKPVTAKAAASHVIEGLRRRKKVIVFPFTGKTLYWMSRWFPVGLGMIQKMMLAKYRKAKAAADLH